MTDPPALTMPRASLHNRILYVTTYCFGGADKIDYVRVRVWIGRETCAQERSTERGFQRGAPPVIGDSQAERDTSANGRHQICSQVLSLWT